jgi:hypothetical protein
VNVVDIVVTNPTNTLADPRFNGCPVLVEQDDTTFVIGVAISPNGFQGMIEIIPIDLIDRSSSACYTYIQPTLMFHPIHDPDALAPPRCYHPVYGEIDISFRFVDMQAEKGVDCTLQTSTGATLWITGGVEHAHDPLVFEPCIEVGPFVFQRAAYGKVMCVAEIHTDRVRDTVVLPFNNRIVKRMDEMEPVTFDRLTEFFKQDRTHFRIHWMDGRTQYSVLMDEIHHEHGVKLSAYATLWYPSSTTFSDADDLLTNSEGDEEDEGGGLGVDEEMISCIDECDIDVEEEESYGSQLVHT